MSLVRSKILIAAAVSSCLGGALAMACNKIATRDLPEIRQGVCGNGVVDEGEDCDLYAPEGQQCGMRGGPGACRFTCDQVSEGGSVSCPTGWRCGTDGVCRSATGSFDPSGASIEAAVVRVLLGDFQGNGSAAVLGMGAASNLGAAYTRLFFLEGESVFESNLLGFPVASPVLRDLSGDGRDDFVFSTFGGIGVLLGQPTHELAPYAYPITTLREGATTLAYPLQPYPFSDLDQIIVIFTSFNGQGYLEALTDNHVIAEMPFALEQFAGEPVLADVINDPSSPCGELMVAYRGEPDVWLVQPCKADGTWSEPPSSLRKVATLPAGFVVETGVFLADADGDEVLDLVVGSTQDAFLSFGCGEGRFCSDKDDVATAGSMLQVEYAAAAPCEGMLFGDPKPPIAVGDINDDGLPDVVTTTDLMILHSVEPGVATAHVELCPVATKLVGAWTSAKIADLNSDGLLDVVAASENGLDIEYYAGTGLNRLNLTRITTPAPVSGMTIGDFDGDQVPDLAVGLRGGVAQPDGTRRDGLAIAYGRVQKAPEPIVPIAAFDRIDQVVSAHFDLSDAVEELGVVSLTNEGTQTVTVFLSSGGRQLLAPFGLVGAPEGSAGDRDIEGIPLAVTMGDFDGDGLQDLGSLAISSSICTYDECRFRLWLTPSGGGAELKPSSYSEELPAEVLPFVLHEGVGAELAAFIRSGDLDNDGASELLLIGPWGANRTESAAWVARLAAADARIEFQGVDRVTQGPVSLHGDSHPIVTDLDGDGQVDVVAVGLVGGESRVVVAWGTAGIDLSHPEAIEIGQEARSFDLIQADTDEATELVVVGPADAVLIQRSPAYPRAWESKVLDGIAGGTSVAARDINGDGVDDLAIADQASVRVYYGKASNP